MTEIGFREECRGLARLEADLAKGSVPFMSRYLLFCAHKDLKR
jgi:hypothetical protein